LRDHTDTGYYHLLIAQATASEAVPKEARKIIKRMNSLPYEVMARIFSEGQKEGTVKDFNSEEMSLVFWTTVKGLSIHKASHKGNFRLPDSSILLDLFIKS
jgi:hypothetical protein